MSDHVAVATTLASRDAAERLAARLVEARLAACAQVSGPVTSVYRWRGMIETAEEWTCTVKTRREMFDVVAAAIRTEHDYAVPEIVAYAITDASPDYRAWLDEAVGPDGN